jgi:hypothetical protein
VFTFLGGNGVTVATLYGGMLAAFWNLLEGINLLEGVNAS